MTTKTRRKYIICDAAKTSWGKTTTLLEVINLFKASPTMFTILSEHHVGSKDHWIVLQEIATSKTILIQTQGDYKKSYNDTLKRIEEKGMIDIIICASRLEGPSCKTVEYIAKKYGYEQINFSNFCPVKHKNILFKIAEISDVNKVHLAQLIFNFALAL